MKNIKYIVVFCLIISGCDVLNPKPVDLVINNLALNEPNDVASVEVGLYSGFRSLASPLVLVNDISTDMLIHNGTFSEYRELSNKDITSANSMYATIWGSIYGGIYISNFILEKLPLIEGVPTSQMRRVLGTAHFCRGYAYFIAANGFGNVPLVTTTDVETNKKIPMSKREDILAFAKEDLEFALANLPENNTSEGLIGKNAARAALARFYLYNEDWVSAEKFSSDVINTKRYKLDTPYTKIVDEDDFSEAILEVGFTLSDDPGTSNYGLNNMFKKRREIIPSNKSISMFLSAESGIRWTTLEFNTQNLKGSDNGWSVAKYGTADEDNNDIVIFRLAEMYLIRAEARAHLNKITGSGSAEEDINILRKRAGASLSSATSQSQMLLQIERERVYELSYEGHRWFDLVRTGRASEVMTGYTSKWRDAYERWPVPIHEIQNNPSLKNSQNPGY